MTIRLANTTTRPVELHLSAGVVVLPALAGMDCDEEDLALPHLQALCRSGVLVATEVQVVEAAMGGQEPAAETPGAAEAGDETTPGDPPASQAAARRPAVKKAARRPRPPDHGSTRTSR